MCQQLVYVVNLGSLDTLLQTILSIYLQVDCLQSWKFNVCLSYTSFMFRFSAV